MRVTGESTTTVLSYEEDIWKMHCHVFVYINSACLWFRISPLEFSDVIRCRKTFYFLCIVDLVMCGQGCVNFQDILRIFSMLYEGCKGRYRNEIRNYFVLRLEWGGSFSNMTLPVYLYQYTLTTVSLGTIWIENEHFGLVLVKTIVFRLKTGFKNPSTGQLAPNIDHSTWVGGRVLQDHRINIS